MTLTPAGSHRGDAAVRTIDGMTAAGTTITDLCVDRGYNFCLPDTFAYPMWARNVDVWGDLHPNQRGQRPGPIPGTIWIDGTLFTEALPRLLRSLTPPGAYATTADAEAAQADFDRRRAYAFTPLTKRDPDGYQRLKGPALAGQVRCPNVPRSLRLAHTRPTTNCSQSAACACGKTVTITPQDSPRERMPQPWGTTDWAAAYYRRSAIESTNAELKNHRLDIGKGFTRVFGVVRNTLLCAFAFAGMNVRMIRDWHALRHLPDPWAVQLGEADLAHGAAALRAKKTRARRRTRTLPELLGDPPPDIRDGTGDPS